MAGGKGKSPREYGRRAARSARTTSASSRGGGGNASGDGRDGGAGAGAGLRASADQLMSPAGESSVTAHSTMAGPDGQQHGNNSAASSRSSFQLGDSQHSLEGTADAVDTDCDGALMGGGAIGPATTTGGPELTGGALPAASGNNGDEEGTRRTPRPDRRHTVPKWDERLEQLIKYKAEHGHCSVSVSQGPLGGWVQHQRKVRKKGKLLEERVQKLDELGFVWAPPRGPRRGTNSAWNERLDELAKYQAEHGHCNVPQSHGPLGKWVQHQRLNLKEGKLLEERVQKLDELGIVWAPPRGPRGPPRGTNSAWNERLDELARYKAEHGHCSVPAIQGSLGRWVHMQRRNRKKGKLLEERVQKLDELGFVWAPPPGPPGGTNSIWNERLDELAKYKAEHGHCNVPASRGSLGRWVHNQRSYVKKGELSKECVKGLDGLDFNWGTSQKSWDERFEELSKYQAEHGHCKVPRKHRLLSRWVERQRQKKGELSGERVQKLDGIGFDFSEGYGRRGSLLTWDELHDELIQYKSEHGHCNVPQCQGYLGNWVHNQRTFRKYSKLTEERIRKLDVLGFDWVVWVPAVVN